MPITVKLSSADARAWRSNQAQWVSPDGYVLRPVTPEEEKAIFPAVERVKAVGRSGRVSVEAEYRIQDETTGTISLKKVPMEVMFRVTQTGREKQNFLIDVFVNGNRYVKGREIMEKRYLEKYGNDCILQGQNGKRIKVLRDPNVRRPGFAESQRTSPSPQNCHCRGFKDNPDMGRHHMACEWNTRAPTHERALPTAAAQLPVSVLDSSAPLLSLSFQSDPMQAPVYARPQQPVGVTSTRSPVASLEEELKSPKECDNDCRGFQAGTEGWRWPAGRRAEPNQHHPMCKLEPAWRRHVTAEKRMMLFDLDRRVEVREATSDEIAQGEIEQQRSGITAVKVGSQMYALVEAGKGLTPKVLERTTAKVEGLAREPFIFGKEVQEPSPPEPTGPTAADIGRQSALERSGLPPALASSPIPVHVGPPAVRAAPGSPTLMGDMPIQPPAPPRGRIWAEPPPPPPLAPPPPPAPPQLASVAAVPPLDPWALSSERSPEVDPRPVYTDPNFVDFDSPEGRALARAAIARQNASLPVFDVEGVPAAVEDPTLRDNRGLVGNQQLTGEIQPGTAVRLTDPEPFVDPMIARRVAQQRTVAAPPSELPKHGNSP